LAICLLFFFFFFFILLIFFIFLVIHFHTTCCLSRVFISNPRKLARFVFCPRTCPSLRVLLTFFQFFLFLCLFRFLGYNNHK
jgi:hypothetical protein